MIPSPWREATVLKVKRNDGGLGTMNRASTQKTCPCEAVGGRSYRSRWLKTAIALPNAATV